MFWHGDIFIFKQPVRVRGCLTASESNRRFPAPQSSFRTRRSAWRPGRPPSGWPPAIASPSCPRPAHCWHPHVFVFPQSLSAILHPVFPQIFTMSSPPPHFLWLPMVIHFINIFRCWLLTSMPLVEALAVVSRKMLALKRHKVPSLNPTPLWSVEKKDMNQIGIRFSSKENNFEKRRNSGKRRVFCDHVLIFFWELKERTFGSDFFDLFGSWAKEDRIFPDKILEIVSVLWNYLFLFIWGQYSWKYPAAISAYNHCQPLFVCLPFTFGQMVDAKICKKTGGRAGKAIKFVLIRITRKSELSFMGRFVYSRCVPRHCQCPAPSFSLLSQFGVGQVGEESW